MWTFSGERKSGTEQLLLTAPVGMFGVVIAKFLSAMILILIPVLCSFMYFGILCFFEMPNLPIFLTSMLGFILLSCTYISILLYFNYYDNYAKKKMYEIEGREEV